MWESALNFIGGWFGALIAKILTFFTALKGFIAICLITIVPIILNNFVYALLGSMMQAVSELAPGTPDIPTVVNFAGLAGYMVNQLGLVDAFSIIISAVAIRFTLTFIPFVGPK